MTRARRVLAEARRDRNSAEHLPKARRKSRAKANVTTKVGVEPLGSIYLYLAVNKQVLTRINNKTQLPDSTYVSTPRRTRRITSTATERPFDRRAPAITAVVGVLP